MSEAVRVVFDCNVLLQGLASPGGPAGRCVQLAFDGRVLLFISPVVLDELRDVASRPKLVAKLHLSSERVDEFIQNLGAAATLLAEVPERFQYERDPDDAHYVNLALVARAKCIVSRDGDLLDLVHSPGDESVSFRARFPDLRIVDPVSFLSELG